MVLLTESVTELVDSKLNINCFKGSDGKFTLVVYAKVNTSWEYGYFEARIMLPEGKGRGRLLDDASW